MPKILIVDDSAMVVTTIDRHLKPRYETVTADNGKQALGRIEEEVPDLVLMDLMMPRMDGWQALERIRRVSECPVIIVTGQLVRPVSCQQGGVGKSRKMERTVVSGVSRAFL